MIDGVTNAGSIPALERLVQFSGARHRLITHNIANLDTPGFRPVDVSVAEFQEQMASAIDDRRSRAPAGGGPLAVESSAQVEYTREGLVLHPEPAGENILFHDGNDRDPERLTQDLVENFMAFRLAADLLRNRFALINSAIRERV